MQDGTLKRVAVPKAAAISHIERAELAETYKGNTISMLDESTGQLVSGEIEHSFDCR